MERLRRVSSDGPGIRRQRRGRGFSYVGPDGAPLPEGSVRRIRALAIPPAWTDVWICPYPVGHLQATGTDAAGRRQYLYHERWRARRDAEKFDRMLTFAHRLPQVRERVGPRATWSPSGEGARGGGPVAGPRAVPCGVRVIHA
jgi:DNA topoisomerase IB